jgi:hypothetical protein
MMIQASLLLFRLNLTEAAYVLVAQIAWNTTSPVIRKARTEHAPAMALSSEGGAPKVVALQTVSAGAKIPIVPDEKSPTPNRG